MSSNEIETIDVNGSRAEQGPSCGMRRYSRQGNIGCHLANPVISKTRKWPSQESKIVMAECYLLSEPTIHRNSWMTELEIEELERR